MMQHLFFLVSDASIVVFIIMSIYLLIFPFPNDAWLKNYRISTRVLSVLFFMMGLFTIIMRLFNLAEKAVEMIPFSTLFISTIQVALFSITLITLLNPWYTSFRAMIRQFSPILLFTVVYILSATFFGDPFIYSVDDFHSNLTHPTMVVRILYFFFFLAQVKSYNFAIFREMRIYQNEIENYFSDTCQLRLIWVKYAYFAALALTLVAVTYFFYYNVVFHTLFVFLYTGFYFLFSINYLQYTKLYKIIKPAIDMAQAEGNEPLKAHTWDMLRKEIVERKSYLRPGITIDEIANDLKVGRKILSAYINAEEKVNFNSWINQLRIEEAKMLLLAHPNLSLSEISERVGFSEQSNFSRQFKLMTQLSPSIWRQNNLRSTIN